MQQKAAMYVAKRFADQVLSSPKPAPVEEPEPDDDLHGQIVDDGEGNALGTAVRLPGLAVYVVTDGRRYSEDELTSPLGEPDTRLFLHTNDAGRLTGLIYVPDPSRAPQRVAATRSDEV
ncbi:MAG: hypothetical protein AVDCRST_MAG73-1479 [uncultured Thermomicrobiales bacterium]|uniref:Uncharacterized protein n=1 Tax=uncultured Thermomicrobiales bacterium TaxID=1645740 RepID=A0A6J4U073_9BACT|nr:MAG: hypothetical protein AVDCRST_MAG73-1479 [uncultured Thermomicrobiales bacterium]